MTNYYGQISSGIRGRQADMMALERDRMKMQQERAAQEQAAKLAQTRQNILQQYFAPAQDELQAMGGNSLQTMMDKIDQGQMPQGDIQTQIVQREARFDPRGAMGALFGAGDIEGAKSIADVARIQAEADKAMKVNGGKEVYGNLFVPNPERPGEVFPAQYNREGGIVVDRSVSLPEKVQWLNTGSQFVPASQYGTVSPGRAPIGIGLTPGQAAQYDPNLQANIAESESAGRERGKIAGAQEAGSESRIITLDKTIGIIDELLSHPGRKAATGMSSPSGFIPGTAAYDFRQKLEQLTGQAFLSEVDKMRGLGALTGPEGQKLVQAAAALNTSQTEEAFERNLILFKTELEAARRKTAEKAGMKTSASSMPKMPPAAQHKGRIVRDTASGVRYQSDGSKWVRVK